MSIENEFITLIFQLDKVKNRLEPGEVKARLADAVNAACDAYELLEQSEPLD